MTKELKYSLIICFGAIFTLMLRIPLEEFLFDLYNEEFFSRSIAASSIRLLLIIALFIFMARKGFLLFSGLYPNFSFSNPFLVLLTVAVILLLSYSSYEFYMEANAEYLFLFTMEQLFVGIFEEFLFRGIIFPLLIIYLVSKGRPVLQAAFLSSVLFGLVHLIALVRFPENSWNIINTVIFAIGVGFFLTALFLRTKNILVPIFIHFLIDFTNGASQLSEEIGVESGTAPSLSTILLTLGVVTILCLFLIGTGLFLFQKVEKAEWIEKVSYIRI